MQYSYKPKGVCSRGISFEIVDGKVRNIQFAGGCSGNTQGVAALADGMTAEEVIAKLSGIRCGFKGTSCPDQLAKAVKEATE
ncbi:MAG: TIGR03905 family TSCPD domain-containing protein [Oscillospiraceae bacterium]|nr:TIGR03905 family TSCPD domain-containing protein [Oscillospiraceae bacterium]MDD6146665.1 TIGR03905 family TSCPD domain-containing protein [Oscillospiraceae bacterium]